MADCLEMIRKIQGLVLGCLLTTCSSPLLCGEARAQAAIGFAGAQLSVNPPSVMLSVTGLVGAAGQVQYTTVLTTASSWTALSNFTLVTSPCQIVDTIAPPAGNRFYRLLQTGWPNSVPTNPSPSSLAWIPPGSFVMGSPASELLRVNDEVQHNVTLTSGFYMGINPVTQGDYAALTGSNPSYFAGNDVAPVESVDWATATAYCASLTAQQQTAGLIPTNWAYRLPTEAEWEYACRAGTTTAFNLGPNLLSGMANFNGKEQYVSGSGTVYNSGGLDVGRTVVIGAYQPNAFGLYEMHGNVCEWCQDWYGPYPTGSVTDPTGPGTGTAHVYRGGSWRGYGANCRSAVRYSSYTASNYNVVGFRVVLAAAGAQ